MTNKLKPAYQILIINQEDVMFLNLILLQNYERKKGSYFGFTVLSFSFNSGLLFWIYSKASIEFAFKNRVFQYFIEIFHVLFLLKIHDHGLQTPGLVALRDLLLVHHVHGLTKLFIVLVEKFWISKQNFVPKKN